MTKAEETLILSGMLILKYNVECYRCLKSVTKKIKIDISECFGKSIDEEKGVFYEIKDKTINIKKIFLDNIILNLPMKEYCREDCRGLCQKCGAVIDDGTCLCKKEEYINPQFEMLKRIK